MPRTQKTLGPINITAYIRRDGICLSFQDLGSGGRRVRSSGHPQLLRWLVLSSDPRITKRLAFEYTHGGLS